MGRGSGKILAAVAVVFGAVLGVPAPAQAVTESVSACQVTPDGRAAFSALYVLGSSDGINAQQVKDLLAVRFGEMLEGDGAIISGLPMTMPRNGDVLALQIAGIGKFDVAMDDQWFIAQRNNFGWRFESAADTANPSLSSMVFDFYNRYDGTFVMSVGANVSEPSCDPGYLDVIHRVWRATASRISNALTPQS